MISFLATLGTLSAVLGASLPPPTGQYSVGYQKYAIPHINTKDPVWPGGVSTSFLATIFYPTQQKPSSKKINYLDPVTAILYESNYQFILDTLASITQNFLVKDAKPIKQSSFPTIIFGPGGYGPPVEVYTSVLSDLASHGYTVIGLDHIYEQPFVRYPNGTGIIGLPIRFDVSLEAIESWMTMRAEDVTALIDYFPSLSKKFGATINSASIGAFGHSLGGASSVGAMVQDKRIKSAVNVDGTFFGPLGTNLTSNDAKRPILLFASEGHTGDLDNDYTWYYFRSVQTGWWRQILVNGSAHHDFSDVAFWKTLPPWTSGSIGPIEGRRMLQINRDVVRAFFDFTLLGKKDTIMNGPSSKYPELDYYLSGNITA